MVKNHNPNDLALRALDEADQAKQLQPIEGTAGRPSFTQLYRYVQGQGPEVWSDLKDVLETYPEVAADFEHLLAKSAFATMPQLAAAAGDAVHYREHDGYVLIITESHAEPGQVYLSIETDVDLIDQPKRLFIKAKDNRWYELAIPPMMNGRAQTVFEKSNPVVHALEQPDTILYIR